MKARGDGRADDGERVLGVFPSLRMIGAFGWDDYSMVVTSKRLVFARTRTKVRLATHFGVAGARLAGLISTDPGGEITQNLERLKELHPGEVGAKDKRTVRIELADIDHVVVTKPTKWKPAGFAVFSKARDGRPRKLAEAWVHPEGDYVSVARKGRKMTGLQLYERYLEEFMEELEPVLKGKVVEAE